MSDEVNVEELKTSIAKLEANNKDLKAEKKKLQEQVAKFDGVDIEALQQAAVKLAKVEKEMLEADGKYEQLYKELNDQHLTLQSTFEQEKKQLLEKVDTVTKENALTSALTKVGVDPIMLEVASSTLLPKVGLVEGKPMVGGKDVGGFVKEWAATDLGKRFVPSGNSGGNATGSENTGTQAEAEYFNPASPNFNYTKQGMVRKTNPELADKLTKRFANKKK
jgi:hypothetical protein